jgi:hypothetical protein
MSPVASLPIASGHASLLPRTRSIQPVDSKTAPQPTPALATISSAIPKPSDYAIESIPTQPAGRVAGACPPGLEGVEAEVEMRGVLNA